MEEEIKLHEILNNLIGKNVVVNKILFVITFAALFIGVFSLFSRQNDLQRKNRSLVETYNTLNKQVSILAGENKKLRDSAVYYATQWQPKPPPEEEKTENIAQQNDRLANSTTVTYKSIPRTSINLSSLSASNIVAYLISSKTDTAAHFAVPKEKYISFEVDLHNKLGSTGDVDIYVCITNPHNKVISNPSFSSGNFDTRDRGEMPYTFKVPIELNGKTSQPIQFSWKELPFELGKYTIELFHDGCPIGKNSFTIRKVNL